MHHSSGGRPDVCSSAPRSNWPFSSSAQGLLCFLTLVLQHQEHGPSAQPQRCWSWTSPQHGNVLKYLKRIKIGSRKCVLLSTRGCFFLLFPEFFFYLTYSDKAQHVMKDNNEPSALHTDFSNLFFLLDRKLWDSTLNDAVAKLWGRKQPACLFN